MKYPKKVKLQKGKLLPVNTSNPQYVFQENLEIVSKRTQVYGK